MPNIGSAAMFAMTGNRGQRAGASMRQVRSVAREIWPCRDGFVSFALTNFTFGGVDKSALNRAAGPRTETIQIPVGLVGKDETGGAFDATMIKWQSTGA